MNEENYESGENIEGSDSDIAESPNIIDIEKSKRGLFGVIIGSPSHARTNIAGILSLIFGIAVLAFVFFDKTGIEKITPLFTLVIGYLFGNKSE